MVRFPDTALPILEKRYLKKDSAGKPVESPAQMLERVADHVARADAVFGAGRSEIAKTRERFFKAMANLWFLPNSPTLMNAGRRLGQLAACFVLPVEDSMQSIFDTLRNTALIHKSGGGTGFSFSRIRPAGDTVSSTAGVSSGPLSFIEVYDVATETVKQGGTRRGANMAVLRVDHPDIEAFITAKNDTRRLNNFNLSVALTGRFLTALKNETGFDLVNPRTGKSVRSVSARRLFDLIVRSAWATGEPGIIFIDRINAANPTPALGEIEATNPCGEQPLLAYESCTLASINLAAMVTARGFSFARLKSCVQTLVHFLDNVIEVNRYPLPEIEEKTRLTRKIGIGVMGFADMLIKLNVAYDSSEALKWAERVMSFINKEGRLASARLARRRGNFPAFNGSVLEKTDCRFMRNATVTTIAPTGTISLLAGVSSGIEPIFAVVHQRRMLDDTIVEQVHPLFVRQLRKAKVYSRKIMDQVTQKGDLNDISGLPDSIKRLFRTAHDISPLWHVKIQAAFQKHTDNAVSKTVNFPADATIEDVARAFEQAADENCKGITIYRNGSRSRQVISRAAEKPESLRIAPRPRPERTFGMTERIKTGCGKLYVTINSDTEGICEVFAQMGKTGGCASSQIEAAGRLISLALRSGVKPEAIVRQLTGIRCPSPTWQNGTMVLSCPDAMAQVLKRAANTGDTPIPPAEGVCPECSSRLLHEEGCLICKRCGYSKCN